MTRLLKLIDEITQPRELFDHRSTKAQLVADTVICALFVVAVVGIVKVVS